MTWRNEKQSINVVYIYIYMKEDVCKNQEVVIVLFILKPFRDQRKKKLIKNVLELQGIKIGSFQAKIFF